jgi:hypothetical protein
MGRPTKNPFAVWKDDVNDSGLLWVCAVETWVEDSAHVAMSETTSFVEA